jgi:cyclic pyranopterin phosphate synthase
MILMTVTDALARPLRDLRVSVTDRCNFRCVYCMPREVFGRDYEFLERAELLTFEEIERLARIFVGDHGVSKIRLTGGEPLVRREVERLVEMLARIPGLGDLAMTTNGSALARKARALGDAGLRRITVSLDSLDNEVFAAVNDVGFPVERVLASMRTAWCRWPATSVAAATSCVSSSTWTSATATAGGWTRWCRRRRSSR